jgi:predicted nuclease of predicted toxin-antitoxin system
MKFKIDQNLPIEFTATLNQAGHDALTVFEQGLGGAMDTEIVSCCQQEERILITADLDLSDIRQFPPSKHPGFIVFRLKRQTKLRQISMLQKILPLLSSVPLLNRLWIVEEHKIRIRES